MSYTAIKRKIDLPANVDQPVLFAPISVVGFNTFSLQFFLDAIAAPGFPAGKITLRISNSEGTGNNRSIPPPDSEFFTVEPGGTSFGEKYSCQILSVGSSNTYLFVGLSGGVGCCSWITAKYEKGTVTEGTITKVQLVGDMGNQ